MNKIDFSHKPDFPFNAATLEYVQGQILLLQQLSVANGALYILSGCEDVGGNVSAGYVVINGEVLPFEAGTLGTDVVIVENVRSKTFKDSVIRNFYKDRSARFGSVGTTYAWADFERCSPTDGILKRMRVAEDLLTTHTAQIAALDAAMSTHTHSWANITGKPNSYIVYSASIYLGEVGAAGGIADSIFTIPIPTQDNTNYIIAGSLLGTHNTDLNIDNDVSWVVGDKQLSSFKIAIREYSPVIQDLKFEFAIIKLV